MVHDVTVADENVDVLECGICYRPLKPPIFQCAKGHVVCSLCSDRLKDAVKCHVCRVAMPGGYQQCHAMERVVDSVRMPCPHAPYGCDTRTTYHLQEEHLLECPHAPCCCPGDACCFIGSVAMLVMHL
ncbi:putative E3 ubiquitin-protein ligase SINA-like 6 [Miscanthus floridulus]|uniref:putative E3 ubiquitin-protein ligase SINA-like 6 n=1 Tax=Miscanthus floridulus TaxID=154761 RepID=UPI00345802B3